MIISFSYRKGKLETNLTNNVFLNKWRITMEEHMKAIVAKSGSEAQDAGAFILEEQPIPEPGTQDLLVRVIAIGGK